MADQKISQLTTESSLSGTYYFPVIKYNTGTSMYDNYKVDVSLFITSDDLGDGASLIGIEDSGALITATTVEGALAENRTAIDAIEADYLTSTAIAQPSGAAQAALTNSTGGTGDGTLSAVGDTSVGDESGTINNNFTELHTLLNALRTALVDAGIIKGSA